MREGGQGFRVAGLGFRVMNTGPLPERELGGKREREGKRSEETAERGSLFIKGRESSSLENAF